MNNRKKITVCAVIVTFNRKDLLTDCLDALFAQTRPVDEILIVDNASTDGTMQKLIDLDFISLPHIDTTHAQFDTSSSVVHDKYLQARSYVRLAENIGGAGGFHKGQERALSKSHNWIWLMDDDGFPSADCLEKLLESTEKTDVRVLNPLVVDRQDNDKLAFGLDTKILTKSDALSTVDDFGMIKGKANPFNGTLLHHTIVEECGLVKKEMFIWGDEREYFWRLKTFNIDFATLTTAIFFHPRSKSNYETVLFGLLKIERKPEKLEMNFYRNKGYINRNYKSIFANLGVARIVLFFMIKRDTKKAMLVLKYYLDGFLCRYKLPPLLP